MASTNNKCQGYVIVAFVIFLFIVSVCLYLPKFVRVVISFYFSFLLFSFHFILCLFYFIFNYQAFLFILLCACCLHSAYRKKKKWISSAHNPKVLDSGFLPHKVQKKKFVIEIKCIGFKKPSLATIGVIHIKQLLHYPRWT